MSRRLFFVLAALAAVVVPLTALAAPDTGGNTTPLDSLSTFTLWSIVGGALTSVVTAVINRSHWSSVVKLATFFVLCCIVAAGNAYFNRSLNLSDWSRSLILVVAAGWTTFIASKPAIKQIEAATT